MKYKYLIVISLFLLFFSIGAIANINTNANTNNQSNNKVENKEEIKTLHKTIDVVITDIQCTWRDNRGAYYSVEYKSDEYNLSNKMNNISNWSALGNNLERRLHEGDILQATLYSTVKIVNGNQDNMEILNRRLGNIDY